MKNASFVLLVAAFAVLITFTACRPVPNGHVGVKLTYGRAHEQALTPDWYIINPITESIVMLDTRLKPFEVKSQSASKDLQVVDTVVSVQHSLIGSTAPKAYQVIGDLAAFDTSVVAPAVLESLKAVTARYSAEELITRRDAVKSETVAAIQRFIDQTLNDKGVPGALHVSNVAITDFDFSHGFNESIEAKVKAQQAALQAETEKRRRITNAEAANAEKRLAADAESYQIEKVSIQRAASIEREAKALAASPLLLSLRAIEKWSGDLPFYSATEMPLPFFNLEPRSNR